MANSLTLGHQKAVLDHGEGDGKKTVGKGKGRGVVLWDTRVLRVEYIWGQTRAELRAEAQGKAQALEENLSHRYYPRRDFGDRPHFWVP